MKRKLNVEPTELQKRVVNNMVEQKMKTGRINKKKAILDAGYSESVSHSPKIVTEKIGFKKAFAEAGITEESFAKYLSADIIAKPANRLGELKLAADLLGILETKFSVKTEEVDKTLELVKSLIDEKREEN